MLNEDIVINLKSCKQNITWILHRTERKTIQIIHTYTAEDLDTSQRGSYYNFIPDWDGVVNLKTTETKKSTTDFIWCQVNDKNLNLESSCRNHIAGYAQPQQPLAKRKTNFRMVYTTIHKEISIKSSYKCWNHKTEVMKLIVILITLGSFQYGSCMDRLKETILISSDHPVTHDGMKKAKPYLPTLSTDFENLSDFVKSKCKNQGQTCTFWFPFIVSDIGINNNRRSTQYGINMSRTCTVYNINGEDEDPVECYKVGVVAVCFPDGLPSDRRCDEIEISNGSTEPICTLEEPSMHGAYQECLKLGGHFRPLSEWDKTVRKLYAAKRKSIWTKSLFRFQLLDGSEPHYYVRYAKDLDFSKKCTVISQEQHEIVIKTADCTELHPYVYTQGKQVNAYYAATIGLGVFIVVVVVVVVTLSVVSYVKGYRCRRIRPSDHRRRNGPNVPNGVAL